MVPILHCLLLLWWGWRTAAGAQEESVQVVQATESNTVILPCVLGGLGPTPASNYLNLSWLGPLGVTVLNMRVKYRFSEASPDMDWGLLIRNFSSQDDIQFTCSWEGNPDKEMEVSDYPSDTEYDAKNTENEMEQNMTYSSDEYPNDMDFAQLPALFPCNGSETSNWTWRSLSWISPNRTKAELIMQIWHIAPYWLRVNPDSISLLLPSVTFRDAGNYTCYWKNQSQHFWLEVSTKSGTAQAVWQHLGKQHWVIWTVALGYLAACLGSLFGFLRLQRAFRAHRQKKKLREPARRKFFHAQRNRAPVAGGILLPAVNGDGKEPMDAFSYENILPNLSSRANQQSLQKANALPAAGKMEDEGDEEEYEQPDSETEQKSEDENNYENTQEEVKQEDVALNDGSSYENSKKERCGSADSWYVNNTQNGRQDLTQDPLSEDGDNYENVEEEIALSPGAARLIAGLRLQLALDPPVDKQDGSSEASTGSQSYEEMNGTLSPTTSKGLHTSTEEDADSYENMESPNSCSLRKEGHVDPRGEGADFGSMRQNLSISFGADLKGAP